MSKLECIICLESKDNLYKCDRCITRMCGECYIKIKIKSCTVCRLDIFNKELNKDFMDQNHRKEKEENFNVKDYTIIPKRRTGRSSFLCDILAKMRKEDFIKGFKISPNQDH